MFDFLFDSGERQRKRQLKQAPTGPLKSYLSARIPKKKSAIIDVPILSVDFETTGPDSQNEHILSIGFVEINRLGIQLATASHQIIRVEKRLDPSNVIIHKITDRDKNNGISLEDGIANLLQHLQGRILLAHYARTEIGFIRHSCVNLYGIKPTIPVIDTLELAARRLQKNQTHSTPKALRLFNLRRAYDLPEYPPHNALYDALSTAELFLAEINQLPKKHKTPLSALLRQS